VRRALRHGVTARNQTHLRSVKNKFAELIKKGLLGGGVERCKAYLWESCQCWKWMCDNSTQKTNWLSLSKKVILQAGESNPVLPQPCFKHDRRVYLSDILLESCQCFRNGTLLHASPKVEKTGIALLGWCHEDFGIMGDGCGEGWRSNGYYRYSNIIFYSAWYSLLSIVNAWWTMIMLAKVTITFWCTRKCHHQVLPLIGPDMVPLIVVLTNVVIRAQVIIDQV